jgi:hypothetical protein
VFEPLGELDACSDDSGDDQARYCTGDEEEINEAWCL